MTLTWNYFSEIIQEISKMFVGAFANIYFVIDLRIFQVSQIPDFFFLLVDVSSGQNKIEY